MRQLSIFTILILGLLVLGSAGCSTTTTVSRVAPEEQIDLSGQWNDVDSQQVASALAGQALATPWIEDFAVANGKKPTLIVGNIANKTPEHIPMKTLVADFERFFINSGRVTVVASAEEREGVRAERQDQNDYASPETAKAWGKERGADFMLLGEVNSIFDAENNKEVKYYQVDCYLVNLEDNTKVWTGFEKIKKYVGRSKYRP
jgi:uncharacterized protein (TIGR02722 family)